jgi:hypothetical protein
MSLNNNLKKSIQRFKQNKTGELLQIKYEPYIKAAKIQNDTQKD